MLKFKYQMIKYIIKNLKKNLDKNSTFKKYKYLFERK